MFVLKKVVYFIFCRLLYHVTFVNQNLEKNIGSCVVYANHTSYADPFFLFGTIKELAVMAKAELFKYKWIATIFTKAGVFPIHRGEKDARSIMHAVHILTSNHQKLLIFPEGTRVKEEERIPAKVGAVYVAVKANVPILPVHIQKKHPRRHVFTSVTITYGTPVYLDIKKSKDKAYLNAKSQEILESIYLL